MATDWRFDIVAFTAKLVTLRRVAEKTIYPASEAPAIDLANLCMIMMNESRHLRTMLMEQQRGANGDNERLAKSIARCKRGIEDAAKPFGLHVKYAGTEREPQVQLWEQRAYRGETLICAIPLWKG